MSLVLVNAAGRLTRRVAQALAGRGEVVLVDPEPQRLAGLPGRHRHGDPTDSLSLAAAFAGADTLLLPREAGSPGAEALALAIEAARGAGIERLVLLSSIDPTPGNPAPWAETDRAAEAMARSSGLGWTILRLSEPMEDFIAIGRRQQPGKRLFANRQSGRSAPLMLDDMAQAIAAALAAPGLGGKTLELTGPDLLATADLASALGMEDVAHKDGKYLEQLVKDGLADAAAQVALGRAVREGYYAVATTWIQSLTGKPPRGLGEALKA